MAAVPETAQQLTAFIVAAIEEWNASNAPPPQLMPQSELAEAREATARAGAALDMLQEHMSGMKKGEEVPTARFEELEAATQERVEELKTKMQTWVTF